MSNKEYIIPFVGLKIGNHVIEYDITTSFFEGIEYAIVHGGNVKVVLNLEKKETMMIGKFHIEGDVETSCARCNEPMRVSINGDYQLIYKFGDEISDDEMLVVLDTNAYELDVKDSIYEFITVSLPFRTVHEEGACDPEMLALYKKMVVNSSEDEVEESDDEDEDDTDEIWAMLKNLK